MPLADAVYWIATEGGQKQFWAREREVWSSAISRLMNAIASESVRLIGRKSAADMPTAIPGHTLSGLQVSLPYNQDPLDLILGDEPYLDVTLPSLGEDWHSYTDNITVGKNVVWSHLQVSRTDVGGQWLFPATAVDDQPCDTQLIDTKRRIPESQIEATFKTWRDGQVDGYIPTEPEDVAHMKQFGVGRDRVRDIREKFPRRKRGQKK